MYLVKENYNTMKILSFLIILLCFSNLSFGQKGLFVNDTLPANMGCGKITFKECNLDTITKGNFSLGEVKITGDCIDFHISYGCGCGHSNFELITDNHIIETGIPKVYLSLKFMSNDLCKALCHHKVSFDLSPFKNEAENRGIIILIKGTTESLVYKK